MQLFSLLLLVAGVTASPFKGVVTTKFAQGRAATVSEADLSNLKFFAQYAGAAYCNMDSPDGSIVTCSDNVCPQPTANKAVIVATVNGNTDNNIDGFVAVDPARSLVVVSYRGSSSIRNWITNLQFALTDCPFVRGCQYHFGFADAWRTSGPGITAAVRAALQANPSYRLVVTGHSLGGAVATIAAASLRAAGLPCDLYTYGSPRVGNAAFAQFVTDQAGSEFRVTHTDDPVPRLPPILFGYRHVSPEYWIYTGSGASTSDIKVCAGTANTDCNAGTSGLDAAAHGQYFGPIAGCSAGGVVWRRSGARDLSDEELEAQLNEWAEKDRQIVQAGAA